MTVRTWIGRLTRAVARPRPTPAAAVAPPAEATPHWSRVEPIFSAALSVAEPERNAFLDRECAADARLRAEIDSLLSASDRFGPVDGSVEDVVTALFAAPEAQPRPATPRMVSHYELIERLPGGGMGVIYRARDVRLRRPVALKFLPPALSADSRAKARFLLEARAAAALDHRNVCTIHEVGETDDGHLFIAMPFYDGETLSDRLSRGPVPAVEALSIASQIAHGLAHAHERGSIHRDIKPANVMLTPDAVVKILDFGIVKQGERGLTRTGVTVGTLPYMSPEQLRRDPVDARTDIWSLGVVIHEMLTGRRPFERSDDHALRDAIVFSQPDSLRAARPDLPHELSRAISIALAKHPEDRHPSARVFAQTLDTLQAMVAATAVKMSATPTETCDYTGEAQRANRSIRCS